MVGFHHFGGLNGLEIAHFGEARKFLSVLLFQMFEPVDGVVDDMVEIVLHTLHLLFDVGNFFFGFFDVEFRNFAHRFIAEFQHIVAHNFAAEKFAVGVEFALDLRYLVVPSFEIVFQNFVDAFFEEEFFERSPVPTVFQFAHCNVQLLREQFDSLRCIAPQHLAYGDETGFVVVHHTAIW